MDELVAIKERHSYSQAQGLEGLPDTVRRLHADRDTLLKLIEEKDAEIDPLEFWCDLAEVLGHPRPSKADIPALALEVRELRLQLSRAQEDIERLNKELTEWRKYRSVLQPHIEGAI